MNPTQEQLNDPDWWSREAPDDAEAAYSHNHGIQFLKLGKSGICYYSDGVWATFFSQHDGESRARKATPRPKSHPTNTTKDEDGGCVSEEWDLTGIPPVGKIVECKIIDRWVEGRVVGYDEEGGIPAAVCRVMDSYHSFTKKCLRTKQQRQRDELSNALFAGVKMCLSHDECDTIADWLIDNGYVKGER